MTPMVRFRFRAGMRVKLVILCLGCLSAISAFSGGGVRKVDFANRTYPWRDNRSWPHDLEWQSMSEPNRIKLVSGYWKMQDRDIKLDEVVYGDLTGGAHGEAIVVLRSDTGGTQYHYWVYIYGSDANQPRLMAYFRAGDRAANGLYRVHIQDHKLIVELFDPRKRMGDCCSSGFVRMQFRWNGRAFVKAAAIERGTTASSSRRRVSIFGLPYDKTRDSAKAPR